MIDLTYSILTEDEWEHMGTGPPVEARSWLVVPGTRRPPLVPG
jgi:hypothetical protein